MVKQPAAKRIRAGSTEEEDRISQLPASILDHVISFLPQNDAVRTCLLSKSWRHLGPTGPKIEFDETSFPGSKEKFLSVVDNTLKRYHDQNLSILEFVLGISLLDRPSISLLEKWIPRVVNKIGLKTFNLRAHDFSLPSLVFEAEFLTELHLKECKLDQINNKNCIFVKLHMLKSLSLHSIYIEENTFDKILSSCPLIQHLVLECCKGLSNVKVNKARNLKHLDCYFHINVDPSLEIDDETPSLETICIKGSFPTRYHHKNNKYFFPCLKSLCLWNVPLPKDLLNNLSSDKCPCLEELELYNCSGFTEFELSNSSIKRLIIDSPNRPIKAAIDAANMLYFEYKSCQIPTFSFSTALRECKSKIMVWRYSDADDSSTWFLKLNEFLKSLNQSQISLDIYYLLHLTDKDSFDGGGGWEPVVVENLWLGGHYSSPELRVVLNCLFRICRPRYIRADLPKKYVRKLAKSVWNTHVKKGEAKFWQQDLEESSIEVLEKNANEWRPGQLCEFSNDEEIRFMLKWRE